MPIKRRIGKAAKQLDHCDIEDLLYGPGTCLFNGAGYLGEHDDVSWRDASDATRAAVLAAMKTDWDRNHARLMAMWADRDENDRRIARDYYGDPAEPWALTEFGAP